MLAVPASSVRLPIRPRGAGRPHPVAQLASGCARGSNLAWRERTPFSRHAGCRGRDQDHDRWFQILTAASQGFRPLPPSPTSSTKSSSNQSSASDSSSATCASSMGWQIERGRLERRSTRCSRSTSPPRPRVDEPNPASILYQECQYDACRLEVAVVLARRRSAARLVGPAIKEPLLAGHLPCGTTLWHEKTCRLRQMEDPTLPKSGACCSE